MSKPLEQATRLLSALELLPLEKCTSDAEEWRQEIEDARRELIFTSALLGFRKLRRAQGLPDADPLRFGTTGKRLSGSDLSARLESVINQWPTWEKEKKRAWKKTHKKRRKAT
jgi:hypothetical protein